MALFDTESFLKASIAIVKANLNNELLLIDTEKNDFVIPKLDADAYFFQNLNSNVFNFDLFLIYGLVSNNGISDNTSSNTLENVRIAFEIYCFDDGSEDASNVFYKMLRYSRALKSVFHKNFDKIRSGTKYKIESLEPTQFDAEGKMMRSSGVVISAALSSQ